MVQASTLAGNFVSPNRNSLDTQSDAELARQLQEMEVQDAAAADNVRQDEMFARFLQEDELRGQRHSASFSFGMKATTKSPRPSSETASPLPDDSETFHVQFAAAPRRCQRSCAARFLGSLSVAEPKGSGVVVQAIREVRDCLCRPACAEQTQLMASRAKQKSVTSRPFIFKVSAQGIQLLPDIEKKSKVCLLIHGKHRVSISSNAEEVHGGRGCRCAAGK